jgi:hypothetical protein
VSPLQLHVVLGEYELFYTLAGLPADYQILGEHAHIIDQLHDEQAYDSLCTLTIAKGEDWPFLVITRHCEHLNPAVLFIPETHLLFVGASSQISAYRLDKPRKMWHETLAENGTFTKWLRSGEFVLMTSDYELAAWDIYGWKKWSVNVESPWNYRVHKGMIELDATGNQSVFPLDIGPLEFEE